jgi:hypothetical protein
MVDTSGPASDFDGVADTVEMECSSRIIGAGLGRLAIGIPVSVSDIKQENLSEVYWRFYR